ncbi:MAG: hypothetical protein Q4E91_07065 [Lachnospiraceae bacterium]|nr:hypothetical protein [Lachnospiraceae bacterium]
MRKRWRNVLAGFLGAAVFCYPLTAEASARNIPDYYEAEDGNVSFQCVLRLPERFDKQNFRKAAVTGVYCSDYNACLEKLAEGRAVLNEEIYPAEGDIPEWHYYSFEDHSVMGTGDTTFFATENSYHYATVFSHLSNIELGEGGEAVSFSGMGECEKNAVNLLEQIGLETDMALYGYGLKAQEAQQWEEHMDPDGGYQEDQYKQEWTSEDDAYLIYGFQTVQSLPVYHELMFLGGSMKYVTADNAVLQAVYTKNGLEQLQVNYLYQFQLLDEAIELQPFEEIARIVSEKLNGTLVEEQYKVEEARLMEMVRHSQNQSYEVLPVWYVEAVSASGVTAVLVDASTAQEVFVA